MIHYIYKIHFLYGYPSGRYYIGRHAHRGKTLENDKYTGSGDFCDEYFREYGRKEGITYIKEILEINPTHKINVDRETFWIGDLYKTDPLCMNKIPGGEGLQNLKDVASKPVLQYDLDGTLVKKYSSQSEAAEALNLKDSSGISKCCLSKNGISAGYIWRFDDDPITDITLCLKNIHSVPIICYNRDGIEVARYDSIKDASKQTNINDDAISKVTLHQRSSAGGFIWRKYGDPLDISEIKKMKFSGKRKVKQYDMNWNFIKEYDSLKEAADATGAKWQAIQRVCLGNRQSTKGFRWEYVEDY